MSSTTDYRVIQVRSYRLQAEAIRLDAEAIRLHAAQRMGPAHQVSLAASARGQEDNARSYERMAVELEAEIAAAGGVVTAPMDVVAMMRRADDFYSRIEGVDAGNTFGDAIAAVAELIEVAQVARGLIDSAVTMNQTAHDEPPSPATEWDYNAYQLVGELDAALARVGGAA